jgi:hypothetical protein
VPGCPRRWRHQGVQPPSCWWFVGHRLVVLQRSRWGCSRVSGDLFRFGTIPDNGVMTRSGRPALLKWGLLPLGLALASWSAHQVYGWISATQAGTAGDEAPIVVLPLLALGVLGLFMALVPCVLALRRRMNPLLPLQGGTRTRLWSCAGALVRRACLEHSHPVTRRREGGGLVQGHQVVALGGLDGLAYGVVGQDRWRVSTRSPEVAHPRSSPTGVGLRSSRAGSTG